MHSTITQQLHWMDWIGCELYHDEIDEEAQCLDNKLRYVCLCQLGLFVYTVYLVRLPQNRMRQLDLGARISGIEK